MLTYPWSAERSIEISGLFIDLGYTQIGLYDLFIDTAVITRSAATIPEYPESEQQSDAAHDKSAY
jgi:hypothetical protein